VAELADAADSSGSPTWKRVGAQGVKFGEPLTGHADGDPELSPCAAWESVETRRPLPKCEGIWQEGIWQRDSPDHGARRRRAVAKAMVVRKIRRPVRALPVRSRSRAPEPITSDYE